MSKTVILHIGVPKTGTSTIQSVLMSNARRLRRAGILYPTTSDGPFVQHHRHAPLAAALMDVLNQRLQPNKRHQDRAVVCDRFHAMVNDWQGSTVLISCESLYRHVKSAEVVATLHKNLSRYKVKVIVYLRRQDDAILSSHQESVKLRRTEPLDYQKYLRKGYFDYWQRLQWWSDVFGKENLIVKVFDKRRFRSTSIVEEFCAELNLPHEVLDYDPSERRNEKIFAKQLELLRYLNMNFVDAKKASSDDEYHWAIKLRRLVKNSVKFEEDFAIECLMRNEDRRAILDYYADGNSQVARTFLPAGTDHLFANDLPDSTSEPAEILTKAEMAKIIGELVLQNHQSVGVKTAKNWWQRGRK